MQVCLHSICQSSAAVQELAHLRDGLSQDVVETLRTDGFERYAVSDRSISDMAYEACARTLAASGYDAAAIDALIIVTESFWDRASPPDRKATHLGVRDDILTRLLVDLGVSRAQVYATWSAACGNLGPALNLARSLLTARVAQRVLLVAADRLMPGASRTLASGAAALSDIAAACIVEAGDGGLQLDDVLLQPVSAMLQPGVSDNFILHTRALKRGIAQLDALVQSRKGRPLRAYDFVVVESFNESVISYFCSQTSTPREKVLSPVRSACAHAFSADLLLSLGMLLEDAHTPALAGRSAAAVSLSSWMLSATTFEVTGQAFGHAACAPKAHALSR